MAEADHAQLERAFRADRFFEAERICRELIARDPADHRALYWLARVAVESRQPEAAKPLLGQALQHSLVPEYLLGMAQSLRRRGYVPLAIELLHSAAQRFPRDPVVMTRLGQVLADTGELDAAEKLFRDAIAIDPAMGGAYLSLALIRRVERGDPLVAAMERAHAASGPDSGRRRDLSFALGRAHHELGDPERAYAYFAEGNRIKRASLSYDADRDEAQTRELMAAFTPELLEAVRGAGHSDEAPVLIVGMPRSGTTLAEQIIAAHPAAAGLGERMDLPEVVETQIFRHLPPEPQLPQQVSEVAREGWAQMGQSYASRLREAAPGAARIADKQLYNFKLLGLLHLMLPEARIVHCTRDPMDNGWSCYTSLFDSGSDFIYDLWEIGHAWRLQDELMAHWRGLFGDRIHTLRYEDMVADPEGQIRALIGHLGLGWDDACLEFHRQERDVSTASVGQVRQPIYGGAVGRWKAYEAHLAPLRAGLDGEPRPITDD